MDLVARILSATCPDAVAPAPQALDLQALVGTAGWQRLPAAVQRRFATGHADAIYAGALDCHCSPIGRLFALASAPLGGPLTTLRRPAVPAEVRVFADGRGGVVWERRLQVAPQAPARIVRSTKELGAAGGLVERTDGGLAMELDVFEEDGALVFRSRRFLLVLGRLRLSIPRWLAPGTCRVEHRDLGGGRFRFSLSMVHPWWGRTFHQSGVFADPADCQLSSQRPLKASSPKRWPDLPRPSSPREERKARTWGSRASTAFECQESSGFPPPRE